MKKFAAAALLLMVFAAPAFAWKKHHHTDPRVTQHPRAVHPQNPNLKHHSNHKPHPAGYGQHA